MKVAESKNQMHKQKVREKKTKIRTETTKAKGHRDLKSIAIKIYIKLH